MANKFDKPKKPKAPMCPLCKTNHWSREPHKWPQSKTKKDD